jgi:hypothetical protein
VFFLSGLGERNLRILRERLDQWAMPRHGLRLFVAALVDQLHERHAKLRTLRQGGVQHTERVRIALQLV